MENKTIQELFNRKSVRAFEKEAMNEADVQTILRAAVEAPTAGNMTLWTAIRVTDEEKKKQLAESCDHQPFIASAPLVLVFCADYKRWFDLFKQICPADELRLPGEGDFLLAMLDATIAAHASVTAAQVLGYGSCYIGDILENCDTQREILNLPEYVKPVCMAVFGKPTQQQLDRKKPARFRVEDVVHENGYRSISADEMRAMLETRQGITGEDMDRWLGAFCKRKWNSDFSVEMTRSSAQMLRQWCDGE